MSVLTTEQKTVKNLLSDKKSNFLVPDYQRPYEWGEKECQTLWDDLFAFAFPEGDCSKFDRYHDEYFLGTMVIFTNGNFKEIIDGQQRITTLMLLLRAFYSKYGKMQDDDSIATRTDIEQCLWRTSEISKKPEMDSCKLEIEVLIDETRKEFKEILKTGSVSDVHKSRYAENYKFFEEKIENFTKDYPSYFLYLVSRILENCIILTIESDSTDTALRIFSTLNDRGKPLSDADIFKAQLYGHYSNIDQKDEFIEKWTELDKKCSHMCQPIDEFFTRYMYYERAKLGIKSSTTEALRKFYEKNSYALLKKVETFEHIIDLTNFWEAVSLEDTKRFSEQILKRLFVLNYAPNNMWTYITSVYYLANRDSNGMLGEEKFYRFLNKITGFILGYSFVNPGVNALRAPIYSEMVNIVEEKEIKFEAYKFDLVQLTNEINNYDFSNRRPLTKSMLVWWALNNSQQSRLNLSDDFQIEHIYARKRYEVERGLSDERNLETIGNKALLEADINIRAADYHFADKIKYYKGFTKTNGDYIEGTKIHELLELTGKTDFTEADIVQRNALIIQKFIEYLKQNDLIKQ